MREHEKIFTLLKREILSGTYDRDKTLPSESKLALRFGVSRPTISRVTLDLKRAGLVITRSGTATRLTRFAEHASGAIGIIDPGTGYGEVLSNICDGIVNLAERSGWRVVRGVVTSQDSRRRISEVRAIVRRFATEKVSGVFLQPLEFLKDKDCANRDIVSAFDRKGIPVVLLDDDFERSPLRSKHDLVGIDNFAAGYAVAGRLKDLGCRRLAFLLVPGSSSTVSDRMRGVACAVLEAGLHWTPSDNVLNARADNRKAVATFLRTFRPDAIVCGNDVTAVRLHQTLLKLKKTEHVRLGGFDGLACARDLGLVTARQPFRELAQVAFSTMLSRIKSPQISPRTVRLQTSLISR